MQPARSRLLIGEDIIAVVSMVGRMVDGTMVRAIGRFVTTPPQLVAGGMVTVGYVLIDIDIGYRKKLCTCEEA